MKKKKEKQSQEVVEETTESRLYAFILSAPTISACKQACEHIHHWSFVKEFHPLRTSCGKMVKVHIFLGKCESEKMLRQTVNRATELMNKCLQQYHCVIVGTGIPDTFFPIYVPEMFIRPDFLNIPFLSFISSNMNCTITCMST